MRAFTTIFMLALISTIYAQEEFVSMTGRIIDVETKEPLPFATINIKNTPVGVVANAGGDFEFSFPKKHLTDTIVFSAAGYQSEKMLAQKLTIQRDLKIELVSKAVVLSEVVVTNKELTALEILELAKRHIKDNYPTKPFGFDAFYRDYKLENDKCISIFEAAISVYDKGYSNVANKYSFKEKVILEQVRKSLSVEYRTHAFKRVNVVKEILRLNDVRYQSRALDKRGKRYFTYELQGYDIVNDRLMYKIKAKDEWEYFIYVDIVTYAIPRIEMDFKWEDVVNEHKWTLGDTIRYKQTSSSMLLDFQMIDGRYYPKYCSFTASLEAYPVATDDLLFTSYLLQEYMVTDIDFAPEEKPEKLALMNPHLKIEDQDYTYDPEFWKNYNIIKLHPRDQKLIRGLEEQINIEEQFSSSN